MTLNELPEIKIVRHARAKCLRLRVQHNQIRLTVPVLCSKRKIQNFMDQAEQWLIQTWQKQQEKIVQIDKTLPNELQLFNLDHSVVITYQTQKQSFIFDDQNSQLSVSDRQPEQYLKAFVNEYAKQHLPLYLEEVSQESSLKFGKCAIRQPKTRWGSCTSKHDIMLNSGLVLFPKHVARYVCVHELAHTKHFNHSPHFWAEVHKHDANFQQHRKLLKTMPMPYWWHSS
ncbi:M48 family metallopeptidase [Acinetobacter terrestris]|uniref:SprT family zinc-dependent metalloprotease n=1 Tax=Acinetobacter terrestris TaxID=2529843 RepID=A0AAW6UWL5_9GAMM|nr:SprT family zinc-dependent metalloprotease [Acinetobacter terrestris]MDK1683159.1 SprT family zinc-dependent metalloprotease [Acinetobacter terrestris]